MGKTKEELPVELATAIFISEREEGGLDVFFPQELREGLLPKEAAEALVQSTFNQICDWLQLVLEKRA